MVTIAFRGTESGEDVASDLIGITTGVVEDQIVSMYNYLLKVFAPTDTPVNQYTMAYTTEAPPEGTLYSSTVVPSNDPDIADVTVYHYLKVSSTALGLGLVPPGATVNFTGHSLGGHLALAASRLFTSNTDQVYTYNALGFQAIANTLGLVDGAGADIIESRKGCFRFLLKQPFRRDVGVWGTSSPPAAGGSYSSTAPCAALDTRAA